jgi:hypothetical protein
MPHGEDAQWLTCTAPPSLILRNVSASSPMLFTLTAIVHAGGALFFAYIAAGYEAAGITRWVGWQ